jgi:hypothetical protein
MVIGLLQTNAYMRCVFGVSDSEALSAEDVDEAAAVRMARIAGEYRRLQASSAPETEE